MNNWQCSNLSVTILHSSYIIACTSFLSISFYCWDLLYWWRCLAITDITWWQITSLHCLPIEGMPWASLISLICKIKQILQLWYQQHILSISWEKKCILKVRNTSNATDYFTPMVPYERLYVKYLQLWCDATDPYKS